jgi:hypothetical protein
MDFVSICSREIDKGPRKGELELFPDFRVGRSKDLMVRGRAFYAIWDEQAQLWSTDEYDVQRLVDLELNAEADRLEKENGSRPKVKSMGSFGTNSWSQFKKFLQNISDNSKPLDEHLTFADTVVKKSDYASKRLPYPLIPGDYSAWDELIGTLYNVEERAKLEWAIGAVVSGDAKRIQKFLVLYGAAGTGKSTYINIVQELFGDYVATFDAKALGSSSAAFATEVFKNNPLVAIQHDGDLSKIEDNTKLNSIISHEDMPMNEKYKPGYTASVNAFLIMGTNQPVKISDAKSGIIRRLIDVVPTGVKIPTNHYFTLMSKIEFELGAIAYHCLQVYRQMGKNYYNSYRPVEMMFQTDVFFNFIEAHFDIFKQQNGATLRQAYQLYKEWCADSGVDRPLPSYKMREELRNYFDEFHDRGELDGQQVRSLYYGFNAAKFKAPVKDDVAYSLVLEEEESLLDDLLKEMPAQYANDVGTPKSTWRTVKTTLADIDTKELHYVKVPENHIVIDFDLKDEQGNKSLERNLQAASAWPATYGELSQGGAGVHLHYIWSGSNVVELSQDYSDGIEVKVYHGDASLRRRVSRCNNVPIAEISSGLPLKEKKLTADTKTIKSEKAIRDLIARALTKEFGATKPSVDFIHKILEDAHKSGVRYDVSDLRPRIITFAARSSNQAMACLKIIKLMAFKSADEAEDASFGDNPVDPRDYEAPKNRTEGAQAFIKPSESGIAFFDVEVYPNLFVICWKFEGANATVVRMINPSAAEVESLFKLKLVGFNNRRYDNHILYAAFMGYDPARLYDLSQNMIENKKGFFGEAYRLSYADIYDFTSKKQSLKKYQIELGLRHIEMNIPWDKPVPPEQVEKVADYCSNDVLTTEATFVARKQDFIARQILADLSGLTVNDSTNQHTARIIFGGERNPQDQFVYTDLSKEFPGYEYSFGKSSYRGEDPSEGGYVYAEPGMYKNVAVLDVASMHPTSIINLNLFGSEFTPKFKDLLDARIAIKNKRFDEAKKMLNGKLSPYLTDVENAKELSYALKIVINIVYGMTSAKFSNPFRDNRNSDNIVAKRGALFMIDLKHHVQEVMKLQVVHIKTDSIKVPNATEDQIKEIMDFGSNYGYSFEHEATYDDFCLVNDAVYIARRSNHWDAVGAQFQHPYVFKKLFSHEDISFKDLCESRQVQAGTMYLDTNLERKAFDIEGCTFVGRVGLFVPVKPGFGGGYLWRVKPDDDGVLKNYAVAGTKGYLWVEADVARQLPDDAIDMSYFEGLTDEAVKNIEKFGSFEEFVSDN